MSNPAWSFDPDADAASLTLSDAPVVETEEVRPDVILDFDAEGRIVRIEVLAARALLPAHVLGLGAAA
jgi:uncharacterized protein YuzE